MKKKLKDLPLGMLHPESRSVPLAEIGLITFDVQVRGKDYRWSRTHGLVRPQDEANVPIPGTERWSSDFVHAHG